MPKLTWIGKDKIINHHREVPFRVLQHQYGFANGEVTTTHSNSGNQIIHGDNLEGLKSLLPQYEGKIEGKIEVARILKAQGISFEIIATSTELSIADIEQL